MYIERGKSKKINIRILEFWIEIWIVNNQQNYNLIHSVHIIFLKKVEQKFLLSLVFQKFQTFVLIIAYINQTYWWIVLNAFIRACKRLSS